MLRSNEVHERTNEGTRRRSQRWDGCKDVENWSTNRGQDRGINRPVWLIKVGSGAKLER